MEQKRSDAHVGFDVLVAGYANAAARFSAAQAGSDEAFHAIFETLAWVGVIRDRLKEDGAAPPPILDGLYYVRNLVLHQGADVLDFVLIPGSALGELVLGESMLGDTGTQGWWWPPPERMPKPRSMTGATEYESHVAGLDVEAVLGDLRVALEGLARR